MFKTEILSTATAADLVATIERAANALRAGELVALPTETVYGLAAEALDERACGRIFEAKGRPHSDPLIVHVPDIEWMFRIAEPSAVAERLAEAFWPGPLTIVMPRRNIVPDIITGGQDTVAVRMSAHPIFRAVSTRADVPLAAPSANRFGRISPTSAAHVLAELGGRIEFIVDGGSCEHGIESTIILDCGDSLEILRHGPITKEQLEEFAPVKERERHDVAAPGGLKSHYAPVTEMDILWDADLSRPLEGASDEGLLAWRPVNAKGFAAIEVLSESGDLREVATNLYAGMRRLDERGLSRILALPVPEEGLGIAIMERLRKAAARE
ncbi:MAG TPA: L-threonylcarbamoyladenylate synthase [Chthoniobacterales bacterium]